MLEGALHAQARHLLMQACSNLFEYSVSSCSRPWSDATLYRDVSQRIMPSGRAVTVRLGRH